MPSAQDCAKRLSEQAYRTLLPQIQDLDRSLQSVSSSLSAGIHQIEQKLEALRHIELPTTELVLNEILGDVIRDRDSKASALVLFAQNLRQKETQEEILTMLLDAAYEYFPRAALFAVRGDLFVGWSSRGYPEAVAREVSSSSIPRSDCPKFEEALAGEGPVTASDLLENAPLEFLKDEMREACCLVPLRVLNRPVALLLAGGAESTQSGIDALSILAEFTTLRLENTALKILYELTADRGAAGIRREEQAVPAMPPEPTHAVSKAAAATAEEPIPEPVPVYDLESYLKPSAAAEPVMAPEEFPSAQFSDEAAGSKPLPEQAAPKAQEARQRPEEAELHSRAKTFARLLVQEIKLYNEHHVVEGRQNQDIYLRLKRDIDRSREMYEKRISPYVSRKIDYFHDEIIRILGDNDPSTLGSDYPGPRVEG